MLCLKSNEVDFLGTANGFEAADPQLALSQPYAEDQPTLVRRSNEAQKLAPDLAGKRVAMLYHYLPPETVRTFYPNADIQLYPSILSAIGLPIGRTAASSLMSMGKARHCLMARYTRYATPNHLIA